MRDAAGCMILILVIIEPLNLCATTKYIDHLLTTDPLLDEKTKMRRNQQPMKPGQK